MQTRLLMIGVASLSLAAAPALAKTMSAQDFVQKATVANQFEIDSSKLALEKSNSDDVKNFAQQMIDDHTATADKMKQTLSNDSKATEPDESLDSKHQAMIDKLQSASGSDFDRKYIAMQTDAHKQAVSLFSTYAKSGKDKQLKSFASNTLPALKEHLTHVKTLKAEQ